MTVVVILQSNYIPWKGYFDLMNAADRFVIYDDCQYTKNDWRNRNRIKTAQGIQWLTIPVRKQSSSQTIRETQTTGNQWRKKHWTSIVQAYGKCRHFDEYRTLLESLYLKNDELNLSAINLSFIKLVNQCLGIETELIPSERLEFSGNPTEKLVDICRQLGASSYLTGPAAAGYIEEDVFHEAGIRLDWFEYSNYPEYQQLYPPFEHHVTILDLLFHVGAKAPRKLKTFESVVTE